MTEEIMTASEAEPAQVMQTDFFNRYMASLDLPSEKSFESYLKCLRPFASYLAENGITQPCREDIVMFKKQLQASGHKPSTVQNYITAIKRFFKWTAGEGLYPDIAANVKGAKVDHGHKKDAFTAGDIKRILSRIDTSTLTGKRDYAVIALMVTDGLRTIEVARANVEDLRKAGGRTVLYVQGKGHEEKAVFVNVSAPVEDAIRDYLAARGKAAGSEPLFASASNNNEGGRMSTRSISRLAKEAFIAAGYNSDKLTAHSLRHTAVTLAIKSGKAVTAVQQFARHANIATTQIYIHEEEMASNTCAASVSAAIF